MIYKMHSDMLQSTKKFHFVEIQKWTKIYFLKTNLLNTCQEHRISMNLLEKEGKEVYVTLSKYFKMHNNC
jgi:hypothetical protein